MAGLLDLSAELILYIASLLALPDLLNIALTCSRLQRTTEPELYREYINRKSGGRSFAPFVRRLYERPEIAKYVHRIELRGWSTLSDLYAPHSIWKKSRSFDGMEESDYSLFTTAAKSAGVISTVLPYENKSSLIRKSCCIEYQRRIRRILKFGMRWYHFMFDDEIRIENVSYDTKFCMLMRAGCEDPLVALLVALLPNIREIYLYTVHEAPYTLSWGHSSHGFRSLRKLAASHGNGPGTLWPFGITDTLLTSKKLEDVTLYSFGHLHLGAKETNGAPISAFIRPESTQFRRLVLPHCRLSRVDMQVLLKACKDLRSLYISTDGDKLSISATELVELLLPFKDTLEEAFIDIPRSSNHSSPRDIGLSLTEFSKLEKFSTSSFEIMSTISAKLWLNSSFEYEQLFDRLPRSIRNLTIIYYNYPAFTNHIDQSFVEAHLEAISLGRLSMPHLQALTIIADEEESIEKTFSHLMGIQCDSGTREKRLQIQILSSNSFGLFLHNHELDEPGWAADTVWEEDRYVSMQQSEGKLILNKR